MATVIHDKYAMCDDAIQAYASLSHALLINNRMQKIGMASYFSEGSTAPPPEGLAACGPTTHFELAPGL